MELYSYIYNSHFPTFVMLLTRPFVEGYQSEDLYDLQGLRIYMLYSLYFVLYSVIVIILTHCMAQVKPENLVW
jgi:hypothetical protein